ncbi:uncharacterized protein [Nicotiana tomentosiformis]|uniref:uncharacterized protein n=1 Tax=Nicotiana tomentosiformis TaxID=4098 RepID=UPI00388CB260
MVRRTTRNIVGVSNKGLIKYGGDSFLSYVRCRSFDPDGSRRTYLEIFSGDEETNNEAMLVKLELLDECRDLARIRMAAQKRRMERYYNRRANLRYFKVGDLVLRKVTRELNVGKRGLTWKGPYQVSAVTGKGSYELEDQDGVKLPSNWNVAHLKRYYC